MKNFVVTIARGFGSGGKYIGNLLSKELNIPCYDTQLPAMLEEYSGINKAKFASVDEKLSTSHFLKALMNLSPSQERATPIDRNFVSDDNLFKIQAELINSLAESQSCIIIGKCANYLLRDRANVVSVYVEAPRLDCVRNIKNLLGVTEEEAHKTIEKTDRYRANYYRYYTGGLDWTDPVAYHMTLNTGKVEREHCAKIITNYLKLKELL